MRHNYLPRVAGVVLAGGTAAAAAVGCSDSTAPGSGAKAPTLVLTFSTPPSDSLGQRTVSFSVSRSDSARLGRVRFYVDSGAGSTAQDAVSSDVSPSYGNMPASVWRATALLPSPGRHTVTVVGVDTAGRALGASATWTVRIPAEAYTLTPLPDSGYGAGARYVHANGTVAGWIVNAAGFRRPALWRTGALSVVRLPGSTGGIAARVNAAGDVLLEYQTSTSGLPAGTSVRVLRADGTTVIVGPVGAGGYCCSVAVDLTDNRLAIATGPNDGGYLLPLTGFASLIVDVARGVKVDSIPGAAVGLTSAGQVVSSVSYLEYQVSWGLFTRGFTSAPIPPTAFSGCDRGLARYTVTLPIDLDESANVLATSCGSLVWLPPAGGTSRLLGPIFGPVTSIHLSRTGQIVAALDPAGTIYLWRAATNRTSQVQVAGGAWKIDALSAVNASGQIAAHGVENATGRAAALLLTPAP